MRLCSTLPILAILAAATLTANADTIYSNFGPGQTYNLTAGWGLGFFPNITQVVDMSFVPTETATPTDVILPLIETIGTSPVNVFIESSSGGAPGAILDSLTQVGHLPTTAPSLVDFICSSCSVLDAGTMYFVVAQQSDPADHTSWRNTLTTTGAFFTAQNGSATGPWTENPNGALSAFEVNGTSAVPEPSCFALIGTGITALLGVVHKNRRRVGRVAHT